MAFAVWQGATTTAYPGCYACPRLFEPLKSGMHELRSPDDGWAIVLGAGYRGTVEQLSPEHRERVRSACMGFARAQRLAAVGTNVVYAVARKG